MNYDGWSNSKNGYHVPAWEPGDRVAIRNGPHDYCDTGMLVRQQDAKHWWVQRENGEELLHLSQLAYWPSEETIAERAAKLRESWQDKHLRQQLKLTNWRPSDTVLERARRMAANETKRARGIL